MNRSKSPDIEIRALTGFDEARRCARMMAESEPWTTLRRGFEASLAIFTDPMREIYVAVEGDRVVGFAVLVMSGSFVGYVQSVGVWPGWRGQGIGRKLMHFAESRILRESPNVFICVSSFNSDAQRLYENLGYQRIGELVDYIVPGHSEILYRKSQGPLSEFQPADNGTDGKAKS